MMRYLKTFDSKIYLIIFAIAMINILASIIILDEKHQYEQGNGGLCSAITGSDGCRSVQLSKYSSTAGIDNPIFGIIGFCALAVISGLSFFKRRRVFDKIIILASIFASSVAIWFLYIQIFVLHRYCIFCLVVDISSLILLAITIYALVARNRPHD